MLIWICLVVVVVNKKLREKGESVWEIHGKVIHDQWQHIEMLTIIDSSTHSQCKESIINVSNWGIWANCIQGKTVPVIFVRGFVFVVLFSKLISKKKGKHLFSILCTRLGYSISNQRGSKLGHHVCQRNSNYWFYPRSD